MKLLLRLLFLSVLALGVSVYAGLRAFRVFTEEGLVAVVRCEAAPAGASGGAATRLGAAAGAAHGFLIEVTQMEAGSPARREKFPMTGDQWSIGGDILKWRPWLTLLGAKSCHKLTRLSSRYLRAGDEMNRPRASFDLNGGTSSFWRWLYRWGAAVPFVDAVYGNAAYVPVRIGGAWGVYVTHSGYLVRPWRESR